MVPPAVTREQFDVMTDAERRVSVASDVIAQVHAGWLNALPGTYLSVPAVRGTAEETVLNARYCHVCAIGAAFVAAVRLGDNVDEGAFAVDVGWWAEDEDGYPGFAAGNRLREHLQRCGFAEESLCLMEAAFEGHFAHVPLSLEDAPYAELERYFKAAVVFGQRYAEPDRRLVGIMENVIQNGDFVP